MKRITKTVLTMALAALALTACNKSDIPGFKKTASGLHYKFEVENKNEQKVNEGDILVGEMTILFDTIRRASNVGQPRPIMQAMANRFEGDLPEGLLMMHKGDKATFAVDADAMSTIMQPDQMPPFYVKGTKQKVYYEIHLDSIITKEQADAEQAKFNKEMTERQGAESSTIAQYISDNNITAQPDEEGLYVIVKKKGNGPAVATGKKVAVNYTGRLLNGKLFDTSVESVAKADGKYIDGREYKPFEYTVGSTSLIRGWDKGIAGLPAGSSVRLIIPSALGYGERGAGEDIPPFSPLMFDIDIISVN